MAWNAGKTVGTKRPLKISLSLSSSAIIVSTHTVIFHAFEQVKTRL